MNVFDKKIRTNLFLISQDYLVILTQAAIMNFNVEHFKRIFFVRQGIRVLAQVLGLSELNLWENFFQAI